MVEAEVHVWRASLDAPRAEPRLRRHLTRDELARAERFLRPVDRLHSVVARGLLRELLAGYVGAAPRELRFEYPCACGAGDCARERRKPRLAGSDVRFSVAHSAGVALFAVTRGREVGGDVEAIRAGVDRVAITEQFFSRAEARALAGASARAFFRTWTRKEAYAKARGEGLSRPFDRFRVTAAGKRLRVVDRDDPRAASRFTLVDLGGVAGFAAALAVEGPIGRLSRSAVESAP
jgi:4'-phosphopantetheinyl transferase